MIQVTGPTVNVSKADKSRFWVAVLLDDLPVGTSFEPGRLHLTIIPWFTTTMSDEVVKNAFTAKFERYSKFQLKLSSATQFGPHKDVRVNLVNDSLNLFSLHSQALELFNELGARWAVKNPYVDKQYRPHIRRRQGSRLKAGQIIDVEYLTLVKARRAEDNIRQVAERIKLR